MAVSLRFRLAVGAALWSIGVFAASGAAMMHLFGTHPEVPKTVHGILAQTVQMLVVAAIALTVGYVQMRRGFSPIAQLRARLADVQQGRERQLRGDYPTEVQPLVTDLNALLAARDASVSRAQAKAGDLAHGLKTPLAVLLHEADQARANGHHSLADTLTAEIVRMRRQIDYHLAQARAGASAATAGTRADVARSVAALLRTMARVHADRKLSFVENGTTGHARVEVQDLDEMLGNLLDNASKWARATVQVSARLNGGTVVIAVDDDGPGLDPAMRNAVLSRGVRVDESAPGSGLGLAIVRELAVLYGGAIALTTSPLGGLRAELTLPAAN
jgi:signal transduction histidine kinase